MMIGDEEKAKTWMNNPDCLKRLQKNNYDFLKKLISQDRKPVNPEYFNDQYKWNRVIIRQSKLFKTAFFKKNYLLCLKLQPNMCEQDTSKNTLYKTHARVKLK